MLLEGWSIWLLLGAALVVAEMFVASFFLFPLGLGAFAAAAVAFYGASTAVQWLSFGLMSAAATALSWRFIANRNGPEPRKANVQALLGTKAVVIERIEADSGRGRVKVASEEWRATPLEDSVIEEGSRVVIVEARGTHLVVKATK